MKYLFILFILIGGVSSALLGYGRSGNFSDPVFFDAGNTGEAISVSVTTSTPVQIYDITTTGKNDREILLQNMSESFDIFCGTHSAVSASSGPRFLLPLKPSSFTTNGKYNIWCIVEENAGSRTIEILGVIEYDSRD